ncbi:MAG: IPT/TIG domain-containing protein, partial [Deltaproteobacteria bacterium]|nr:IPT/TIG domain-containing protein [Deltaproteobacteria bacterium]
MSAVSLPLAAGPSYPWTVGETIRNRKASVILGILAVLALTAAACGEDEGLRITSIEPKKGTYLGGDTVTIFGSGFQAEGARDVVVYFGNRQGKVLAFDGDKKLKVQAPSGDKGKTVDVVLIFGDARRFTYPKAYTFIEPSNIKVDDLVDKG